MKAALAIEGLPLDDPGRLCAMLPATRCAQLARAAILALPVDDRARLAPLLSPAALARARREERDQLLARLAMEHAGDTLAVARAVHQQLTRYAAGAGRYDRDRKAPGDPRNVITHRILCLCGGNVISISRLRAIFGAKSCLKKPPQISTAQS